MSSIHYKFRATLEYKTLGFDGLSILASELKREICAKENIKAEAFDLVLQNAHTKRQYASDEQIPRNISIIVQRVPKEDGEKLPKIQGVNTGMVQRADASMDSGINVTGHIVQSEFDKLTEEERLTHIKSISTSKFDPSNYQKRPSGALTGPPPPTYTCNRCHQPGHWFKNCPLLNQKRTTGIPSQELMETTADDPQAMLHPSGKYVIPIMHWRARQHKKNVEGTPVLEKMPPKELICPLCDHLFKDAVVTTCCGISFCADCISQSLLESEDRNCPGENCHKTQVSVDSLVPNRMLRQMVSNWEAGGAAGEAHERVRIGLAPSSNSQLASSSSLSGRSPSTQAYQPPVSSVPISTTAPMPVYSLPPQHITLPTSFAQPPPNMIVMAPAETPLAPPGTTTVIPSSTLAPLVPAALPPIPGVQMVHTTYNPTPKSSAQFMDAWEAFLNRNDKPSTRDRDYGRRRKRSRERRRSRSLSDDRKRSRRGRDDRRDRDRSKERSKRRDYESKDSHRSRYKTEADSDKERKHRKERSPEKKRLKEEKPEVDEEAAIDDALKEVEEMNIFNKSDGSDGGDVDAATNVCKSPKEQGSQSETSERGETSGHPSPEAKKSSELESTPVKEASPRNRSSDSESTQGKSEEVEKMNEDEHSDKEKSDQEDRKRKKDKKAKKHKKEKKHKKDRNETEEERKERKKLKKEKKEKKRREKEERASQKDKERKRRLSDSDDDRKKTQKERKEEKDEREPRDRYREKERSSRHDKKDERPPRTEKGSRKENEAEKRDPKSSKSTKLEALALTKDDFSTNAVVDEKRIRHHFSPPPTLLQTKKITLNI